MMRTRHLIALMSGLILLAGLSGVFAAPGDLDPGFDGDGKVTTDLAGGDFAYALANYPDDKIIAAGRAELQFGVVRYNADGSLDTTFSGDGIALTNIDGPTNLPDTVYGVAIDFADQVVAVGDNGEDFALARFRGDTGGLDTTFNDDGREVVSLTAGFDSANAVVMDANFKIVAAGAAGSDFGLVRYNLNGTLENNFDGDGKVITSLSAGNDVIYDLIEVSGSKYMAIGTAGGTDFAIMRYNNNGTPDISFSDDGKVITDLGTDNDVAYAAAFDNLGRLLVGGRRSDDSVVVRYLLDGTLDPSFDGDGIKIVDFDESMPDMITDLVIQQPNNRIVTAGELVTAPGDPYKSQFMVMRFTNTGALDTTFSGDGVATTGFLNFINQATGIIINSTDRIIVGGFTQTSIFQDFALARFDGGDGDEPTWTATQTFTRTPTETPTETEIPTDTPSITPTDVPPTDTPTYTATPSVSVTPLNTASFTPNLTATQTATSTPTATGSATASATASATLDSTATATATTQATELLVNNGFEAGALAPWVLKKPTNEKIKCDKPEKPVAHSGDCAFLFKGGIGEKSALLQNIDLDGLTFAAGDTLTVSTFINAKSAAVTGKFKVIVTYGDATPQGKLSLVINSTTGYTALSDSYVLVVGNIVKIKVQFKNTSPSGKIFVDDVSLTTDSVGGGGLLPLP